MKVLNFYSSSYQANLVVRRKTCTIRLGDKRDKYQEGDVVWVTYGNRYQPRERLFCAVVDRVSVKSISDLSAQDMRAENDDFRSPEDVARFLSSVYDRPVSPEEMVSVIYFSEVKSAP